MEKKVVLLVLVIIAIAAFLLLGGGLARDGRDRRIDPERYHPDAVMERMDRLFARTRKPLDLARLKPLSGCTLENRVLSFTGLCNLGIDSARTKSSEFVLRPGSGTVSACYGFSREGLEECWADPDQRAELDEPSRFVVTKDGGFLRLECSGGGTGGCSVSVR